MLHMRYSWSLTPQPDKTVFPRLSFSMAVGVTGIALTKLDGTAKGGIVANISRDLQIPIRFIGIGEKIEDLQDFNPDEFIDALFQESK